MSLNFIWNAKDYNWKDITHSAVMCLISGYSVNEKYVTVCTTSTPVSLESLMGQDYHVKCKKCQCVVRSFIQTNKTDLCLALCSAMIDLFLYKLVNM